MALDMANSDSSSSTVRVLVSFYLVATENTCSIRTSAIHQENSMFPMKFYVWRWTQRPLQLCKDFKPFTGLAEIAKNKGLRDNPEITHQAVASRCFHSELKMPGNMSLTLLSGETECMRTAWQITLSYHALSSYWGAKSYSFFRRSLKTHMNLKYQPQGPTFILHSLAFVEIRLFYIFSWKENQDSGYWYWEKEEGNLGGMVHYVILYYVLPRCEPAIMLEYSLSSATLCVL